MVSQIHFTKSSISSLSIPKDKARMYYKDDEIPSLYVAVFPSGKKTYYLYKRIGNSPSRIKLGLFPDMSVEQARKTAMTKLGEIAKGENPADKKRQLRKEITFGQLFEKYMNKHSRPHKKSAWLDQSMYNTHLKSKFKNTKLSDLTSDKIRDAHAKIGKEAKTGTNRVLDLISSMFNEATRWGLYIGENPVRAVKKFRTHSRDRFLLPDEMPKFFKALQEEPNEIARDYIYMSLFTGARKSNVLSMRWDELNLKAEQPYWKISGEDSKNDETMQIPLSKQAIDILKGRKKKNPKKCKFVFPGYGKSKHLADPKKAWKRILKAAGISNLRLHDLRRTLGSWLASANANVFMIAKALGHKSLKSTSIYARLHLDPVAQSVEIATKAMVQASKNHK